jgi:hypothetical protein
MMKRSNGDIQTPKQPEVMIKSNSLFFLQYSYICKNNVQYEQLTINQLKIFQIL